jgi:hypothetical protein
MAQLVGQNCARCRGRVTSELDARFCSGCGQPIHNACIVGDSPPAPDLCRVCGSQTAVSTVPVSPPPLPASANPVELERFLSRFRKPLFFLITLGVVLSVIGIILSTRKDDIQTLVLRIALLALSCVATPLLAARKGYDWIVWVFGGQRPGSSDTRISSIWKCSGTYSGTAENGTTER